MANRTEAHERPKFVYHDLDFDREAPVGMARCKRCGNLVRDGGFFTESCPGPPVIETANLRWGFTEADWRAIIEADARYLGWDRSALTADRPVLMVAGLPSDCVACVFCDAPVPVAERHLEHVRWSGAVCDPCWHQVATPPRVEFHAERRREPRPEDAAPCGHAICQPYPFDGCLLQP